MLNNNDVQEAIISKLLANVALTATLGDEEEVREAQWQGITFVYPCVRVDLGQQVPSISGCDLYSLPFTVKAFSEKDSSKEANHIAYLVSEALKKPWSNGTVRFLMIDQTLVDAVRSDRTWVAEVRFATLVYHA